MPSPDILDFERLLTPISDDHPAGEDLRWDPIQDEIKEARKQGSRDLLEDGDQGTEAVADWGLIFDQTTEALSHRTKDLMLAAWLTEALISNHGFPGCRDGFRLINHLLGQFWDSVYPQIQDGDLEMRLAPIVWCTTPDRGGRLPLLLREVPLFPSSGSDGPVLSWNFWQSCFSTKGTADSEERATARKQEIEERQRIYQDAVKQTSRDDVQLVHEDLQSCLAQVSTFSELLQQRFERLAPGITPLRKALEDCADVVGRVLKDKGGPAVGGSGETSGTSGAAAPGSNGQPTGSGTGGPLQSREDAFRRLEQIATYLRQIEPHSPVPYLVQRAVNWGRMPFEQLLQELLKESAVRGQVTELLGIKSTDSTSPAS